MIEGIKQIGSIVKQNLEAWETALEVLNLKEGKTYKIAKIDFNTTNEQIEIDLNEEYEKELSERKYKFVRLQLTGRQPQFFVTFTDKKRLLGEVDEKTDEGKPYAIWLSIKEELKSLNENHSFLSKIEEVFSLFYSNYVLETSKVSGIDNNDFTKFIKTQLGKNEEIALWTILLDGEFLVNMNFYNDILRGKIIESKKKTGEIACSLCSQSVDSYFDDFARLPLKYFINDKFGFSQNLSGDYNGNFILCEDCYIDIFAGQKFVSRELSDRIGLIDYMTIPEFIQEPSLNTAQVKDWSVYIKTVLNPFEFVEEQKDFYEKLIPYKDFDDRSNEFLLNYLFYEQNNQELKIYGLIKDISASNVREIRKVYKNVSKEFKDFEFDFIKNDISSVYWLIPLRKSKTKIAEIPKVTSIFSAILNREPLGLNSLIEDFTLGIRSKYYENPAYNITSDQLESYIIQTNAFLAFLRRLNLIVGGSEMTDLKDIPNEFIEYIQKCAFDQLQAALFLLGTLIADIGREQIRGSENKSKKPILNKINFQGMTKDRIVILRNEVCGKLAQEKLLNKRREKVYATSTKLMDENLEKFGEYTPQQNVYYLLSGYAFKTLLNINEGEESKKKKEAKNAEQQQN